MGGVNPVRSSEDLIAAVKYLYEKDFRTSEIARRLDVSPFTVRNVISILKKKPKMKEFVWESVLGSKIIIRAPENVYNTLMFLDKKGYLSTIFNITAVARFIKAMGLGEYEVKRAKTSGS